MIVENVIHLKDGKMWRKGAKIIYLRQYLDRYLPVSHLTDTKKQKTQLI